MILVRNSPHDNEVITYLDYEDGVVIKSSYSMDGISRLRREHAGYGWYFAQAKLPNASARLEERGDGAYARLYVKHFSGRAGECYKSLSFNRRELMAAVKTYYETWPGDHRGAVPIHGDFSLGNMIFHEEACFIIDWEHFHLDAAPWGFDLVNLLYESAFFSFRGRARLPKADLKAFIEMRELIGDLLARSQQKLECTLEDATKFVAANQSIWGKLVKKLPITKFTAEQADFIARIERDERPVLASA